MGFNFGFFGTPEHRTFNYRPRYYDPEKEELKDMFGKVDGSREKEVYAPGSLIKGSFRNGNYKNTTGSTRTQKIAGLIALILAFVVIFLIAEYWPYLLKAMGVE